MLAFKLLVLAAAAFAAPKGCSDTGNYQCSLPNICPDAANYFLKLYEDELEVGCGEIASGFEGDEQKYADDRCRNFETTVKFYYDNILNEHCLKTCGNCQPLTPPAWIKWTVGE